MLIRIFKMKKGKEKKSSNRSGSKVKKEKKQKVKEEDEKEDLSLEENQSENLYSLLGVQKTASKVEIRKAYRRLVFLCHPDKNKTDPDASTKFANISRAYEMLSEPECRKFMMKQVNMMKKTKEKSISVKL